MRDNLRDLARQGLWLVSTVGIPRRDQTNIFQPQVPRSGLGSQPFSLGHVPVCSFSMSGNATDQDLGFGHAQSHCRKSFNFLADSQDGLTMVPISGQNENSACDGRGIPYAAPPVGELRWKPPRAPAPWRVTRKADELSAGCPQSDFLYRAIQRTVSTLSGDPSQVKPVGSTSEDCLYLNVMTTNLRSKSLQPVMLWIHGGGGVAGRGGDAGASLASMGAVVVTINYGLGVFGWLSHPALIAESAHQSSGNYGLLDQIAALEWVRQNIAKFGSDPANVTIFGQSSGGDYVGCLMLSPLARGLFQRVIMQSGVPLDLYPSVHHPREGVDSAEKLGVELAHKLAFGDGPTAIRELRSASTDAVFKAAADGGFGAIVDGWVLPDQPPAMFANRQQADVPVIVGAATCASTAKIPEASMPLLRLYSYAGYSNTKG
jgi:para-nitrobenzyl esterase